MNVFEFFHINIRNVYSHYTDFINDTCAIKADTIFLTHPFVAKDHIYIFILRLQLSLPLKKYHTVPLQY